MRWYALSGKDGPICAEATDHYALDTAGYVTIVSRETVDASPTLSRCLQEWRADDDTDMDRIEAETDRRLMDDDPEYRTYVMRSRFQLLK